MPYFFLRSFFFTIQITWQKSSNRSNIHHVMITKLITKHWFVSAPRCRECWRKTAAFPTHWFFFPAGPVWTLWRCHTSGLYVLLAQQHRVIKDKHGFVPPSRKPSKASPRRPGGLKLVPLSQTVWVQVWSGAAVASFSVSKARVAFIVMYLIKKGNMRSKILNWVTVWWMNVTNPGSGMCVLGGGGGGGMKTP